LLRQLVSPAIGEIASFYTLRSPDENVVVAIDTDDELMFAKLLETPSKQLRADLVEDEYTIMKGQYKLKVTVQYLKRAIGLLDNQYCFDGEPKYIPLSAIVHPDVEYN
jgi:hypothetical protein